MAKRAEYRRKEREAKAAGQSSNLAMWLTIGGIAVVGAIMLALIFTRPASAPTTTNSSAANTNADVPRIAVSDAGARFGQPGVVFVDTRSPQEFSDSHIPGAVNMPLPDVPARYGELPQTAEIITYCT